MKVKQSISIDDELLDAARSHAFLMDRSLSWLVSSALEERLVRDGVVAERTETRLESVLPRSRNSGVR